MYDVIIYVNIGQKMLRFQKAISGSFKIGKVSITLASSNFQLFVKNVALSQVDSK